jgi:hypothetical protein
MLHISAHFLYHANAHISEITKPYLLKKKKKYYKLFSAFAEIIVPPPPK